MSKLSRRSLVTSAAALPALAVPAVALASIIPDDPPTLTVAEVGARYASLDDDAKREISAGIRARRAERELLRLGAELEAVIVEWHAQQAIDRARSAAMTAASDAAGFPRIPYGSLPNEEYRAYQEARSAIWQTVAGDADDDPWNDIHDRMWPLIDAIMAIKPRTLAGLGVNARAITLHYAEQWEAAVNADDQEHHRAFMEAVCAIAGVVPVPLDAA
jgi:hypothetical protein